MEDLKRTEEVTEQRHRARIIEQQRRQAGGTFFAFGPLPSTSASNGAEDAATQQQQPRKAVELAEADTT